MFTIPQETFSIVELWSENERKATLQVPLKRCGNNLVSLISIMDFFKANTTGLNLIGKKVFYTSPQSNIEVYCGQNPFLDIFALPFSDFKFLKLRVEDAPVEEDSVHETATLSLPTVAFNREKLTVKAVIEKVNTWKKLVTVGECTPSSQGGPVPLSNSNGAHRVKLTEKQIKNAIYLLKAGRKFGYKFASNMEKSIRDLVDYVTLMKRKVKNGSSKGSSLGSNFGGDNANLCQKCGGCRKTTVPKLAQIRQHSLLPSLKWKPVLPPCPEF